MKTFKPLKKLPLSREIEDAIKESIANGDFVTGDKLPSERELCDQFKVSRVTVREALKNLEQGGLVLIKRGVKAGAYLSELRPDPITENLNSLIKLGKVRFPHLIHARLKIEPEVARSAAKNRKDSDIERLDKILVNAQSLTRESRFKQARLVNVSFHLEIARILQNPIISFITESITQSFSSLMIEETRYSLKEPEIMDLIGQHRSILDAIINQDSNSAYDCTVEHLFKTYQQIGVLFNGHDDQEIDEQIRQELNL